MARAAIAKDDLASCGLGNESPNCHRQKLVTVVRSGLAGEVQHIRNLCDLSLEVVCDQLGWQQSKLSRMERGHQCISAADLASLLVIYQVKGAERRGLLHLVERQDEPGRWMLESPLVPTPLMRLEAEAISLVNAQPLRMSGLVQTTTRTSHR